MMRFALPPMRQATGLLVLLLGLLAPMATAAQSRRTASPAPLRVLAGKLPAPTAASVSAVGSTSTCISIAQEVRMQEAGTWKPGSQTTLCTANPGLASQDRISRLKPNASATSSLEYEPSSAVASTVIPGGGFSGFQLAPSYQASPTPLNYSCTMLTLSADFLRTGHKDVVTIDSRTQLHFLANKGDGTFAAPVTTNFLPSGSYYTGYATALVDDFDNDGYPDLIVRDTTDSLIVFLRNNHDGTFTNSKSISIPTTYYGGALMLGDVTGDGVADLVIFRTTYSYSTSNTDLDVYVYAGNGTGDFSATPIETDYTFEQSLVVIPNQGALLGTNAGRSALYIEALSLNSYGINGSTVFALPVNGDGTFGDTPYTQQDFVTANIYVNTFNSGMSLADLNGDGIPDLTMSFMDGYIYSALGQSDGTFPSVVVASPTVEVSPQSWAIRDIDGDGIPDFVAKESISLEVLPGLGTGKFGTAPVYYAAISSSSGHSQNSPGFNMVLDDLDGDGILDLAYVDGSSGGYNRLNVFHGYGDGTYFGGSTLPAQSLLGYDAGHLYGQALLDTNGDGYDDILALDTYGSGNYPYRTALNNGKGGFTFVKALDGVYGKYGLGYVEAVADLNRDGLKDLVLDANTSVSSYTYNYTLAVAVSNGDGSFRTPTFLDMNGTTLTSNLASVAVGDINDDGVADIVAVTAGGYYDTAAVITFLGNSDGTFQPAITQPFGHSYAYAGITLADLNGDGKLDLLISDDGTSGSVSPYLSVIFGDNSGKFNTGAAITLISGLSIRTLQVGDVNGDGKPDLAVFSAGQQSGYSVSATDRGVILYLNNGDGTFTRGNTYDADMIPGKGLLVDINGDGKLDIINTVDYATDTPAGDNSGSHLLLGTGDGTFGTATNLGMEPGISTLASGDLDGDGTTDLMSWSYYYGGVEVIRNISGSTLSLAADNKAIVDGDGVNLSATVTPSVAHRDLPSGTVTFLANGTVLGTATLQAGTATFYASELPVGTDTITAIYSGDTSFSATKSSSSLAVTVSAAPVVAPDFTLSAPTAALTLARGASGTTTFSVAANATFSGTLSLASSDLPAGMSVLFSPNSVALTPNGSATVTVVVSTTSSTVASSRVAAAWLFAMPLVGSLLCFGGARRRAFRLLMLALALSASFGAMTALSGCGSDSPVRTTHTGDYTIVVKATPSVSGVAAKAFNVTVHVD